MDEDDKSRRGQREAASWQYSTLTIPAIIVAVILMMVGSAIMGKRDGATPSPSAASALDPIPDEAEMKRRSQMMAQQNKLRNPDFMRRFTEKSKTLKGDFGKLTPAEQTELNAATQGHGKELFEKIGNN